MFGSRAAAVREELPRRGLFVQQAPSLDRLALRCASSWHPEAFTAALAFAFAAAVALAAALAFAAALASLSSLYAHRAHWSQRCPD